jgi:hypothetical protein
MPTGRNPPVKHPAAVELRYLDETSGGSMASSTVAGMGACRAHADMYGMAQESQEQIVGL